MVVVRHLLSLHRPEGVVVTLGTFDGVHPGHEKVIQSAVTLGQQQGQPVVVVTFWPLPKVYFRQVKNPLMRLSDKLAYFKTLGVDAVVVQRFNQAFSLLPAQTFVEQGLVRELGAKTIVIGDDFKFGSQRQGDAHLLEQIGLRQGFSTNVVPALMCGPDKLGSSRIRQALEAGQYEAVEAMLGRPWSIRGRIQKMGDREALLLPTRTLTHGFKASLTVAGIENIVEVNLISNERGQWAAWQGTRPTLVGAHGELKII